MAHSLRLLSFLRGGLGLRIRLLRKHLRVVVLLVVLMLIILLWVALLVVLLWVGLRVGLLPKARLGHLIAHLTSKLITSGWIPVIPAVPLPHPVELLLLGIGIGVFECHKLLQHRQEGPVI